MKMKDFLCKYIDNVQRALDSRTRTTTSTRFSRATMSARKPASFWREKRDIVVILAQGFAKMLSCQNKSRTRLQPFLPTKSKINRPGYKFPKYFR